MKHFSSLLQKNCWLLLVTVLLISSVSFPAKAESLVPDHKSYTNSYSGAPAESPVPYVIERVITGEQLGCGNFNSPMDVFRATDGKLYIADTGNSRIVVLDAECTYLKEFASAEISDTQQYMFNGIQGVFVTETGDIYVADTENSVVIHMDSAGKLIRKLEKPEGVVISENMVFKPTKVVVDPSGRIHVLSLFVNQGIIEYSPEGDFEGFLAAGKVNPNPVEVFWKKFSTEAQRARMVDFVPIEYNNLALDDEGFIFATMAAMNKDIILSEIAAKKGTEEGTLVRKLNMLGNDILRREGFFPPVGDVDITDYKVNLFGAYKGPSTIVDVSCGKYGMFSILDSNRKRIFTYDGEGNMLYAFGGANTAAGGFATPMSMAQSDEHHYVIDKQTGALTVFVITEYGRNVLKAIELFETGLYDDSAAAWELVLQQNANMDLAYSGIGKALYRKGQYLLAMDYFKYGNNKNWYSKAYQEHRKTLIAFWFPVLAMVIIAIVLFLAGKSMVHRIWNFVKGG